LDELHWSRSIFALGCWLTAATIDLMVQGYFTWFGWAQRVKIGWGGDHRSLSNLSVAGIFWSVKGL